MKDSPQPPKRNKRRKIPWYHKPEIMAPLIIATIVALVASVLAFPKVQHFLGVDYQVSVPTTTTFTPAITPTSTSVSVRPPGGDCTLPNTPIQHSKLGETVTVAGLWMVTLSNPMRNPGGGYVQPSYPGDDFLVLTLSLKNISVTPLNFNIFQFSVCDTSANSGFYTTVVDTSSATGLSPNWPSTLRGKSLHDKLWEFIEWE